MFDSETRGSPIVGGNDAVPDSRPDAAHIACGFGRPRFRPPDPEEQGTYRKWRRSALIFYGACALVLAAAAVTRSLPAPSSSLAGKGGDHSIIAAASKRHALD